MPAGGVVILVDETKDPRSFFPRMVILTPEKHQELMNRIAQLEKQLNGDRKPPHTCILQASVEGDAVRMRANLHFQVEHARTNVLIGFRGAQLSEATIRPSGEGKTWQPALIDAGADGYAVLAESPGEYDLQVQLRVPLARSNAGARAPAAERSFELALPGAAVTTMKLDLPEPVKELRWNKTNVENPPAPQTEEKHWEVALAP